MRKVTKAQARKAYNATIQNPNWKPFQSCDIKPYIHPHAVILVPSKCSPLSMFACSVNQDRAESSFDRLLLHFEYYNCSSETGNKVHFYLKNS